MEKETMEKKLANVELTMENVEYWDIPAKYIRRFYCDDLRTALSLQEDINGHRDGRISQEFTCKTLVLAFDYEQINALQTFALDQNGRQEGLGDRLKHCRDITWVTLHYDNGDQVDIRVPWNFRSDTYNYNMYAEINKFNPNEEVILISSDDQVLADSSYWMERSY